MANVLGVYNPIFYAQEALIQLEKALGMGNRVHRGFERERSSFGLGDTISIRRPSVFSVSDAPLTTPEDLTTETVSISLNKWREVKFKLSDQEWTKTGDRIIEDHIRPAAYALADDIDQKLAALYKDIPWLELNNAPVDIPDLTAVRRLLFDNQVPISDIGRIHLMIDGLTESILLQDSAFSQQQGAGDVGVSTQLRGFLGMKFGMEIFANQNVQAHTSGTSTDDAQDVDGALLKGATSMDTTLAGTGTIVPGDTFVFASHSQRYAVTNTTTASTNAHTGVTFTPPLKVAVSDAVLITFITTDAISESLAFHRNAFALALVPLPSFMNELGARVATVTDPVTGLSIRSRIYYVGNSSEVHVALDVLYGVKTLDPNLAVRLRDAA